MAEGKKDIKIILEREYVIPLRREFLKVPRYKRTNKAIKAIKQFIVRHMKVYDRDLNKVKIDKYVNEEIWFRGIKKPPTKIKIKAIKQADGTVKVELAEIPPIIRYKIEREKRTEKAEKRKPEHTEAEKEKLEEKIEKEKEGGKTEEQTKEEKKDRSEKEKSTVEAGLKAQKKQAKQAKHTSSGKKQVIHRMALQK